MTRQDQDPIETTEEQVEEVQEEVVEQDELQELRAERDKLKDQLLRSQADLQNYRKRIEREKSDTIRYANEKYLNDFLPVVDTIERANQMMQGTSEVKVSDGIDMIRKQMLEFLDRQGVKPIEAVDQPFDHNLHHAVLSEDSDKGEGIVLEELQRGYTLNDRVLRPAMVKVSK